MKRQVQHALIYECHHVISNGSCIVVFVCVCVYVCVRVCVRACFRMCINMCMPQTAASVLHEVCRYRSGCVAMAQHEHVLKVITQLPFGTIQMTEANAAIFRPSQFGELEQALAGIYVPDHSVLSPLSCWWLGCMNLVTSDTCLTRCFNALLLCVDRSTRTRRSEALKKLLVPSFCHLFSSICNLRVCILFMIILQTLEQIALFQTGW